MYAGERKVRVNACSWLAVHAHRARPPSSPLWVPESLYAGPVPGSFRYTLVGDGGQMPNNRCTNCVTYNLECSYVEAAKVRPKLRLAVDIPLISDSETRTPERVCCVGTLQRMHRLNA